MLNMKSTDCPKRQLGWMKTAFCVLIATILVPTAAEAQCSGEWQSLDATSLAVDCHLSETDEEIVEVNVSSITDASQLLCTLQFETPIPRIDTITLEWENPTASYLPQSELFWSQNDDSTILYLNVVLDACEPVTITNLEFQLKAFCASNLTEDWRIATVAGGIVQVDVIQSKSKESFEIQQFYTLDGILIRESVLQTGTPPATEGLGRGIYLLRRIHGPEIMATEKVLVW
jgi:hypothetical protein